MTPDAFRTSLVRSGTCTPAGELAAEYGGAGRSKHRPTKKATTHRSAARKPAARAR
jgi:hypothetical protein